MVVSLLACSSVVAGDGELVFKNNFNHYQESQVYLKDDWLVDWLSPQWSNGIAEERVAIVSESEDNAYLAVTYPAGKIQSKESGAQWKTKFETAYESATLTYRVKFAEDFDFVRGGKMPGLVGGTPPTGSKSADGTTGWSARFMWREKGTAIAYTQHMHSGREKDGAEEDRDYFKRNGRRFRFATNQWYTIEQKIKMNDPEKKNGHLEVRVDGRIVLSRTNIQFRKTDQLKIDQLYFSTFYGGSDASWQPSKQETIFFDDFEIIGYP